MAFLDNSGDIILDAVLTDLGRRKMAQGGFSVTSFALGDDEIDYSLYNKNHPSGSAYYDLEILQTPVFEAFTQTNAGINYGLLATTAADLLYLPVLKTNENGVSSDAIKSKNNLFWVTDEQNDITSRNSIGTYLDKSVNSVEYMFGSTSTTKYILIEGGLETTQIKATQNNTATYLGFNGLVDEKYYVYYDSRFISSVAGLAKSTSTFNNESGGAGELSVIFADSVAVSIDAGLDHYVSARIGGQYNRVYYRPSNTTSDTDVSTISGPRGTFTALAITIKPDLGSEYTLFGSVNSSTALVSADPVDYIDTTIYVQGVSTSAQIQIPVRIIRRTA